MDPINLDVERFPTNPARSFSMLFGYANGRPTFYFDPLGLEVEICSRPADLPLNGYFGIPHRWLRTGSFEAGLGPLGGSVPGFERSGEAGQGKSIEGQTCNSCPYLTQTTVLNHSGQGAKSGASCRVIENVDEDCVNKLLSSGENQPQGRWAFGVNDCWAFVRGVVSQCLKEKPQPIYIPRIVP